MLDTLIAGARIVDGSGAPWFVASVGIADGRIAGIFDGDGPAARRVIPAEGRYLAPGFIDAHTHDDLAFLRDRTRPEKTVQGVTTIVTGNCSFSPFPASGTGQDLVRQHLGSLLSTVGETEVFTDYAAFARALAAGGIAPNIVQLVGHGPIRLEIMGYANRAATADERAAMEALLDRQLAQGAAGLSLGLMYPPSSWADAGEMTGLARIVARHGGVLAAHIRNYDAEVETAIDEFLDIVRSAGAKGLLSHLQICGRDNWGRMPALLDRLERARRDGVDISCDMYPYTAGSSTILQLLPPSVQEGGIDAVIARLAGPDTRESIRRAVAGEPTNEPAWHSKVAQIGWSNIRIGGVEAKSHRRLEGLALDEAARQEGCDPFDLTAELIACDCGRTNIIMFQQDESDLTHVLAHRLHMTGSDSIPRSGGRPHPRAAGTFARLLAGALRPDAPVPLEETVRRMTSLPAQRFGLWDRGLVRPGMAADLVLFSAEAADRATYDDPRLPPVGIDVVMVAGQPVAELGAPTGRLPGRALTPGLRRGLPP
jgi:N-acyl-D-amino-acid deacylase